MVAQKHKANQKKFDNMVEKDEKETKWIKLNELNKENECGLCQRSMPIFVEDSDNLILRLPERFLPPFLLALKQEYLAKKKYLRVLRINSKIIK